MSNEPQRRHALVTGGSSGIGLATARGLAGHFEVVGIVGRNADRLEQAARDLEDTDAQIETFRSDFSSLAAVRKLATEVERRFPSLDVLVNNAGVWHRRKARSADGYEETFAVNHLAHFALTNALEALLARGAPSRVIHVSSSLHRRPKSIQWDDLMFDERWNGFSAYAHSKLANVVFSNELARRWKHLGITSNALNPGNVRSRITRNNGILNLLHNSSIARLFILTEEQGAQTSVYLATAPEVAEVTGRYFEKCAEVDPNPAARDHAAGRRLWEVSQELVDAVPQDAA